MLGITETAGDPIISISHEYLACKKRNIILFIHSEHTNKRIVPIHDKCDRGFNSKCLCNSNHKTN